MTPTKAPEDALVERLTNDAKVQAKTAVAIRDALEDQDVQISPPQMLYVALKALEAARAALTREGN